MSYPFGNPLHHIAELRACRVCGCTETEACVDGKTGLACHWVGPNLCSACVDENRREEEAADRAAAMAVEGRALPIRQRLALSALSGAALVCASISVLGTLS